MKVCILLLMCLLAISSAGAAADETSEASVARRVAQIMYFGAPQGAPEAAYVHQIGEEVQEVELGRHNFSKSFIVSQEADRLFVLPRALLEDETIPANAPSVTIPEDWKKVLILVFEDQSNPLLPIRLKAINANDDEFGPGELFFVNFSEMTVFGMVGEQKLVSKPFTTEIISKPRKGRGPYMLKLDAFHEDVNKRRRLIQQKCHFNPKGRMVTFMVAMPPPRMVKVYSAPVRNL